jgi:predicted 2-oxoglutarate/Fe(II)-dependent dioxygenase YbiX
VFEPQFCRQLIELYGSQGGADSGFMRERDGNTVGVMDYGFKRRKDFRFDEAPEYEQLRAAIRARINRRLIPEIRKTLQFNATRIERYVVACYEGETGGFFRAHRDNTTKGTAHRIFACTFNLNAEDYEGGDLRFPEYGRRTYRAPTGGVVVFSCSLLHEALPVTKGLRYAFLPFLYDDAAAKIRAENLKFLTGEVIDRTAGSLA